MSPDKSPDPANSIFQSTFSKADAFLQTQRRIPAPLPPLEQWSAKDEISRQRSRPRIVNNLGKELDSPGPGFYCASDSYLSTNATSCLQEPSFHIKPPPELIADPLYTNNNVPGPGCK